MAKLTRIPATRVTIYSANGNKQVVGYYRNVEAARRDWGKRMDIFIETDEVYHDPVTDKIYVLTLAGTTGKFND